VDVRESEIEEDELWAVRIIGGEGLLGSPSVTDFVADDETFHSVLRDCHHTREPESRPPRRERARVSMGLVNGSGTTHVTCFEAFSV
jgi:hypothetical protein